VPVAFEHYAGREQAFIKHSLLRGYFSALIHKIASKYDEFVYVDGFSGPWGSADEEFSDTSFGIAMAEMRKAKEVWAQHGRNVRMRALLVEKRKSAYRELETVPAKFPDIDVQTFRGEFVALVPTLASRIPSNAFSFVFIDPKGWRIDMNGIAPLIRRSNCEVLFNFMFEFINRAASMSEPATVQGVDELITIPGWRPKLATAIPSPGKTLADVRKEILVEAFSDTMRAIGSYKFVAETPIFRPMKERTLYSLIYATRKSPGIVEFRKAQVEAMQTQETVRSDMRNAKAFGKQTELFGQVEMGKSETEIYLEAERVNASALLLELAPPILDRTNYADVWPRVLAKHAVTKTELNKMAAAHRKEKRLIFPDWQTGKKVPSEDGRIARSLLATP
jgi:three-Cys-motif partner protein